MRNHVVGVASRSIVLSLIVGALLAPETATAAVCTWTGGNAANANWSNGDNWAGCAAGPVANDSVVFPANAARPATTNNIAGLVLNSLTISGTGVGNARYTIAGNSFTVTNAVNLNAPADGAAQGPDINASIILGASVTITHSTNAIAHLGAINLNGHQLTFDVTNASGEIFNEGIINGVGLVRKSGNGQIVMFASNAYQGNTQVLDGRIGVAHNTGLGAGGAGNGTFVNTGAHVYLFSVGVTVVPESMTLSGSGSGVGALYIVTNTIEVSGDIVLIGPTTEIGVLLPTGHLTLSGNIIGNAVLNKSGDGRLTLRGNNSFTETLFEQGSLFINGNQPTVGTDMRTTATLLGGTGTTGGTGVQGGRIAPGLSPGILNTASFTLNAGAAYEVELAGTTPGIGYDQLNVTGLVSLAGNLTGGVAFAPTVGTTFTIVNNDAADAVAGTFNGLPEGTSFPFGGLPFRITYVGGTGNDIVLTYSPVVVPTMPWPMLLFLAMLLAALVFRQLHRGAGLRGAS